MINTFKAIKDNLRPSLDFIEDSLEIVPMKIKMQIEVVSEEIIVNIINYAYKDTIGNFSIDLNIEDKKISITFIDNGIEFNPLLKEDPDISLSADEREIGGLGIFMIKKMMNDVYYEYKNNENRLTIIKEF